MYKITSIHNFQQFANFEWTILWKLMGVTFVHIFQFSNRKLLVHIQL